MEVSASILSVKKENCIQTFYNLETSGIDYFHIDVMDGEFVKNNTIKIMTEYTEYLNTITNIPLDVHLMVKDVMTKNPKTIGTDELCAKALAIMEKYSITSLAVVDDNNVPIGLLHIHDLLRAGVA